MIFLRAVHKAKSKIKSGKVINVNLFLYGILFGLGVFLTASTFAQTPVNTNSDSLDQENAPPDIEGAFYIIGGTSQVNSNQLLERLHAHGFTNYKKKSGAVGFGLHATNFKKKLMVALEYHYLDGFVPDSLIGLDDRIVLRHSNEYWSIKLGYPIGRSGPFRAYTLAGFGRISTELIIGEDGDFTYEELMENPNRQIKLITDRYVVDLSFGIDIMAKLWDKMEPGEDKNPENPTREIGGLFIGIRVGGIFEPFGNSTEWKLDGGEGNIKIPISGGPDIGYAKGYIRLTVGLWGSSSD